MSVLCVADVTHVYPDGDQLLTVLDSVSLQVSAGELVCVAGPSGSGKSSLCHLAAGFEEPRSGSVLIDGRPPVDLSWAQVAVLPQQHGLLAELTVRENITLPSWRDGSHPPADQRHLESMLAILDLSGLADRPVAEVSIGEQQRAAIARALVGTPRLAVLDEPTGHQDDEHVEGVVAAIRGCASRGSALLVATHDDRVLDAADRVVRLDRGRVAG